MKSKTGTKMATTTKAKSKIQTPATDSSIERRDTTTDKTDKDKVKKKVEEEEAAVEEEVEAEEKEVDVSTQPSVMLKPLVPSLKIISWPPRPELKLIQKQQEVTDPRETSEEEVITRMTELADKSTKRRSSTMIKKDQASSTPAKAAQ